jgi:hypothetical protein
MLPLNTPLLFIVFNRPDPTAKVFEVIRKIKPRRLYLASDGPRSDRHDEWEKVNAVREIISKIDWECEVKHLFNTSNVGCKKAVYTAISWMFEHEEEGIILEDDCLPHADFFTFCEEMLFRYRSDDRVWAITGDNFQNGQARGEFPYYFSKYIHVWGWATWRRCWNHYDPNLRQWPSWSKSADFRKKLPDSTERNFWGRTFDRSYRGEIDTWDFQWVATLMLAGGLTATPQMNLVTNIGFGADATHTIRENPSMTLPSNAMPIMTTHPAEIQSDIEADKYVFEYIFYPKGKKDSFYKRYIIIKSLAAMIESVRSIFIIRRRKNH